MKTVIEKIYLHSQKKPDHTAVIFENDSITGKLSYVDSPNFTSVKGTYYVNSEGKGAYHALLPAPAANLTQDQKAQYIEQMKSILSEAGSGAHIRVRNWGHSIFLTYVGEDTIKYIEGNGSAEECTITEHEVTWDEFVFSAYGKGRNGISYYIKYNKGGGK